MRVSASMLGQWMACPLQAKFHYIDHLPSKRTSYMTFGNCVHDALELYNTSGDVDAAIARFKDIWDNPEKINCEIEVWPKGTTYGGFRERGINMLREYDEKLAWENRIVVGQEHKFCVPIGDHYITGAVDLLEVRKSGRGKDVLRVVDYKTGSKQPFKPELALNIQFTIYVWATMQKEFWLGNGPDYPPIGPNAEVLWEKYQDMPRRAIWFHLMTCKEIDAGPRDDSDFMRLYRVIKEVSRAIESEVFVPCISGASCGWCDYTKPCGIKIPERQYDDDFFF